MNVIGLDGKEYKLSLTQRMGKEKESPSKYHLKARELLHSLFPLSRVVEEVTLPGTREIGIGRTSLLYADFFIPDFKLMVEVHGEQHYKHIPFFHKNVFEFARAKARDKNKEEWCRINDVTLVVLPFNETLEEWRERINDR